MRISTNIRNIFIITYISFNSIHETVLGIGDRNSKIINYNRVAVLSLMYYFTTDSFTNNPSHDFKFINFLSPISILVYIIINCIRLNFDTF